MATKTERLNLRISPAEQERLEKLVRRTDAASAVEVIRRALAVYEHLWEARDGKSRIVLRDQDGHETDLLLL